MNDLAPVQTAIYAALTGAPATYPVYDPVPQGVPKPFFVIGEWTVEPDEQLSSMTTDASLNLHAWSATNGKAQIYAMLAFARGRLDGQSIAGTWLCTEDFAEVMEDPGSTAASRLYHAVVRYRLRLE